MIHITFWENTEELQRLIKEGMKNAAVGLTQMTGRKVEIDTSNVKRVPLSQIDDYMGDPETEMVGVYLLIEGDFSGQSILLLPVEEAMHFVDLILGDPIGSTKSLDGFESSVLAEAGNIATSFFLNKVAVLTKSTLRPSPPAVMIDMLGAILDIVALPVAMLGDDLIIAEATFKEEGKTVLAHFWVLPRPHTPDEE